MLLVDVQLILEIVLKVRVVKTLIEKLPPARFRHSFDNLSEVVPVLPTAQLSLTATYYTQILLSFVFNLFSFVDHD